MNYADSLALLKKLREGQLGLPSKPSKPSSEGFEGSDRRASENSSPPVANDDDISDCPAPGTLKTIKTPSAADSPLPQTTATSSRPDGVRLFADAQRDHEDAAEYYEERSAISEYDGELPRREAEEQAARRIYEYRLSYQPTQWMVVLALPGVELEEQVFYLRERFGAETVLEVRPYKPWERDRDERSKAETDR